MICSSRSWLEFRISSSQRVVILLSVLSVLLFMITLKGVVWVFFKLTILRGGGVLERTGPLGQVSTVNSENQGRTVELPGGDLQLVRWPGDHRWTLGLCCQRNNDFQYGKARFLEYLCFQLWKRGRKCFRNTLKCGKK